GVQEQTDRLIHAASALKDRLGPLLFQFPPSFQKDLARLKAFVEFVDGRAVSAFEFRHESWNDDEVVECLRVHSCALCIADTDEAAIRDLTSTADWSYVRLRRVDYTDDELAEWVERLRSQNWREAYVFFKHEDAGTGPKFAARLLDLLKQ